jgi:hypothetical protein
LPIAVITAGIAIEIGATLVAKGLEIALPEIGKIAQSEELGNLASTISKRTIVKSTASTIRSLRVR